MSLLDSEIINDLKLFENIKIRINKNSIDKKMSKNLKIIANKNRIDYALPKIFETFALISLELNMSILDQVDLNGDYDEIQGLFLVDTKKSIGYYTISIQRWQLIEIILKANSKNEIAILEDIFNKVINMYNNVFPGSVNV